MSLFDVIVTDPLPGIVLTGGPIDLAVGQSDSTTFTATYVITQADIVFGSVVNQATASAETIDGEVVDDLSDDDSELEDDPTIVILEGCKLTIFNAVSPNGDGSNDIFYIQGIECYPNNTVEVYNRWGIKVYEVNNYDNISNVFKGYSDGRVTISRNELLPTGTYFYIIKYVDLNGNGIDKSGYLYIQSN
jgi:gliding motility-associated-like protein